MRAARKINKVRSLLCMLILMLSSCAALKKAEVGSISNEGYIMTVDIMPGSDEQAFMQTLNIVTIKDIRSETINAMGNALHRQRFTVSFTVSAPDVLTNLIKKISATGLSMVNLVKQ
jgi:hypothetical protein